MKNCNCHYEIPRDGSGQLCRYLKALDPAYAPVDGRSIEDLLVFAKRYAAQIRFYDIPESKIDDPTDPEQVSWREFFRRDMAVISASISIVDTAQLKRDYDQNREHLEAHPNANALHGLFDPILGMIAQIERWYAIAIQENPLHADLNLAINSTLREQVKKIVAYEEAYKTVDPKNPLKLDFSAIENKALWGLDKAINPDASIYQGITLDDKIRTAALYVDDIFHAFYGFVFDLVEKKSVAYMQFALEAYPAHQPHMALFITFLELFRLAQDQMNGLTERMLNFYYKDVLRLAPKPSIADRVHIVFELAKDIADYDLAQGTALKAGKDASGKEQMYATKSDLVINQAKVKELKSVFIQKTPIINTKGKIDLNKSTIDAIFARPVANSLDGFGEKITDPSGKWPTFGKGIPNPPEAKNICQEIEQIQERLSRKDQAQIGFAIASPQLVLQGGNRLIGWHIDGLSKLFPAPPAGSLQPAYNLEIWLTGEKGWLKIRDVLMSDEIDKLKLVREFKIFNPSLATISGYYIEHEHNNLFIYLPIVENAIVPFDPKLHTGYSYDTSYPVAQIMISSRLGINYAAFRSLSLKGQVLSIAVGSIIPSKSIISDNREIFAKLFPQRVIPLDGLKTFVLQNDMGLLATNKPFDPYTLYPSKGKSFYIGSAEVFNKPLTGLAVNIKKTQDTEDTSSLNDDMIKAMVQVPAPEYSVSVLTNKSWDRLSNEEGFNFSREQLLNNILNHSVNEQPTPAEMIAGATRGRVSGQSFTLDREPIEPVTELKSETTKGFIRISNLIDVNPVSTVGNVTSVNTGNVSGNLSSVTPVNVFGNVSFIQASQNLAPQLQIKEISVSYHSNLAALDPNIDQFFHVYPFGVTEVFIGNQKEQSNLFADLDKKKNNLLVNANGALLPQFSYLNPNDVFSDQDKDVKADRSLSKQNMMDDFISSIKQSILGGNNQYSGDLQEEGMLFIGLEKLRPLDTLSLLFQFAEGSAVDEDNEPPQIHWSYLTNNEWRPLKGEDLISDGTYGFQTTGIVKISVPEDSTDHNTIITDGLRWFCASVTEYSDRIPMLVNVVAQAVEARFQDNSNDQSHFDKALPAGSIGKLAVAVAQVGKVAQPFASFDGKHQEIGKEFYTRVSERLRHKARAITPWDYEHLVLDRFPSIYKVKCITHTDPVCLCRHDTKGGTDKCCGSQIAPGHILIVPIANLKNRNAVNPLQPKTSRRTLLEIQDYLSERASPFVQIHAQNPDYEQMLTFFRVQFIAGADKGYYLKKLNDELVHYLTPWAFDENADVSFAQKFYASAIINFIEERAYVDFITDFVMCVCRDECCPSAPTFAGVETSPKLDINALAHISGCCDMEALVAGLGFIGEVIAEPSTPRSILVSAPKHIIIPYEAPIEISRCEQRKQAQAAAADIGAKTAIDEAVIVASDENVQPSSTMPKEAAPTTRNKKNK